MMRAFRKSSGSAAFTLVEMMIAIGIMSVVLAAIYSSWTAILRSSKVGLDAAAAVQRSRVAIRTIEDSLTSAQCFVKNQQYYGFVAENGSDATLSFVARLSKYFPRSGKFGDLDVRRVTFSVESGSDSTRKLVLRQNPLLMELDVDEKEHPLVLAKNVRDFAMSFWDARLQDWTDEWTQTNQIPKLVMINLKIADNATSLKPQEEITRIISIPAVAVQPGWQLPMIPGMNTGQNPTNVPVPPPGSGTTPVPSPGNLNGFPK